MDDRALLETSRDELACWRALAAAYATIDRLLDADAVDPDALAAARADADAATAALRPLREALSPMRLAGAPVDPVVAALWRDAADAAVGAAAANARLLQRAQARQADVAARLATVAAGHRGLAAYRPATPASGLAGQRA